MCLPKARTVSTIRSYLPLVQFCMDPFLHLIHPLRPRATLWGRTDAAGKWGVSFRKREDLLFCWVAQGECQLTRPLFAPVHLETDDFVLIRTSTPFAFTSDPSIEPEDSETIVAATRDTEFIIVRLMELILVEILRNQALRLDQEHTGLIAGLADAVTARALTAMHNDVAHGWTVAELARLCGVSRSSFAVRFRDVVGTGPIDYLLHWRMALAKDELRRGDRSSGEIALAIGFQSSSAFSTAFTRAIGYSPKRYAALTHLNTVPSIPSDGA